MVTAPDEEAEKIKRRKERKRAKQIREALSKGDMRQVAKLHIEGKGNRREQPVSDECPDCLALTRGAA